MKIEKRSDEWLLSQAEKLLARVNDPEPRNRVARAGDLGGLVSTVEEIRRRGIDWSPSATIRNHRRNPNEHAA